MTLDDFGLSASRLLAGFAGGVVHAFAFKQATPIGQVASIVTGTLTANYFGIPAAHYIGPWMGEGGSSFAVGLCAMAIIQGIDTVVRGRMKTLSVSNGERSG